VRFLKNALHNLMGIRMHAPSDHAPKRKPRKVGVLHHSVLVTGAQGMIGCACAITLQRLGWRVFTTDARIRTRPSPALHAFESVDLRDRDRLTELLARCRPDAVVHAGGFSGPMQSLDDPLALMDVNVIGLANLLDASRRAGSKRFVWFSSILAYGAQPDRRDVAPNRRLQPDTLYGATKAAGECLLATYAAQHDLSAIVLRPAGVYGPGRTTRCLIRTLLEHGMAGRPLILHPAPGFIRQFVYVDDVVQAVCAALHAPRTDKTKVYNIADGHARTTQDVVATAQALLPALCVQYDDTVEPMGGFRMGVLDIHATQKGLGWRPTTPLDAGMARYLEVLRQGEETA